MIKPPEHNEDDAVSNRTSEYQWCLHCERAYKRGEHRLIDGLRMCPYDGCNGDTVLDGWYWPSVRENHSDYPNVPEIGKTYPLYS